KRRSAFASRRPPPTCSASLSSSTGPRPASGRSASSASTSPIGNWRVTSRSSDGQTIMAATQKTITPIDNSVYVERPYATPAEISATLKRAQEAQKAWKATPVAERAKLVSKAVDLFLTHKDALAEEIT